MMRYQITYKKKGERPSAEGKLSTQLIDAKNPDEIFPKLYERLHVRADQFKENFDVVEILEV